MIFQNRSPSQGIVVPSDILDLNTPGSLVIDLKNQKLYSSDGSQAFEIGANLDNQSVANEVSVGNSSVNVVINSSAISVSGVALGRGYTGSQGVGFTGSSGSQGATGFTGSKATGFTGSPGTPGGFTGSQGDQGDQGDAGFTGSPGIPGGYTGSQGDQGNQGNPGYTGSPGTGFTGSQGSGFTGSLGFTGSPGIPGGYTGSPGLNGIDGFVGSQGFTGSKGDIGGLGFTGSIGSPGGFTGSPGPTGFSGSLGFTGSAGVGFTGSAGSQGVIGFTGSGATGFTGSGGFTGSKGTTGFTGSLGTTGFTGSGGFTGSQGSLGFTGSLGTTGFTGSLGTTGFTGSQGVGFTGSQGTQGIQGFTGSVNFTATQTGNATNIQPPPILIGAANTDWLTDFTYTYPYGPYVWMVSPRGTGTLLTATRTMDWNANTAETLDIFNQFSMVVHDNPLNPGFVAGSAGYQGLWNYYWQLTRTANAYGNVNMQILEASLANYGNEIPGDPFTATTPGQCAVATFDSGLGIADANLKSVTVALNILANSKDFLAGIKYGCNALRVWNGYYQAIQLASAPLDGGSNGHSIVWFSAANTISGHAEVNKNQQMILGAANGIYISPNNNLFELEKNNILRYGADPTGVADCSNAFANAIAKVNHIHFPAGTYLFNSTQLFTIPGGKSVSITGVGQDVSILAFANNLTGFGITYANSTSSLHMKNMSITTKSFANVAVYGVSLQGTGNNAVSGLFAQSDFENLTFRGFDGYALADTWEIGLAINEISGINVIGCNFTGQTPTNTGFTTIGYGIACVGNATNIAVVLNVTDTEFSYVGTPIFYGSDMQGMTVSQCNFTGCQFGLYAPSGSTFLDEAIIIGNQFNVNAKAIDFETAIPNALIVGNYFIIVPGTYGIYCANSGMMTIVGNSFQGSGVPNNNIGVYLTNNYIGWPTMITGNIFTGLLNGIWADTTSANVNIQSNVYYNNTTNTVSSNTSNRVGGGSA